MFYHTTVLLFKFLSKPPAACLRSSAAWELSADTDTVQYSRFTPLFTIHVCSEQLQNNLSIISSAALLSPVFKQSYRVHLPSPSLAASVPQGSPSPMPLRDPGQDSKHSPPAFCSGQPGGNWTAGHRAQRLVQASFPNPVSTKSQKPSTVQTAGPGSGIASFVKLLLSASVIRHVQV